MATFPPISQETIQDVVKSIQEKVILDSSRLADTYVPRELKWDLSVNILSTLSDHGLKLLPYYTKNDKIERITIEEISEIVNEESDINHDVWYLMKDKLSCHGIVQLCSWLGGLFSQESGEIRESESYDGSSYWKLIGLFSILPGFKLDGEWSESVNEAYDKWVEWQEKKSDSEQSEDDYWGKYDEISDDEKMEENKKAEVQHVSGDDEDAYYALYDKVDEDDKKDEGENLNGEITEYEMKSGIETGREAEVSLSETAIVTISSTLEQLWSYCKENENITKLQFASAISKVLSELN